MMKANEILFTGKTLKIYDPAMCCPTGVCGTDIDTTLLQLANFLSSLNKESFEVHRYGLSTQPQEYVLNKTVNTLLQEQGVACLPLFFLDEQLILSGAYPSVPTLSAKMGLSSFVVKL